MRPGVIADPVSFTARAACQVQTNGRTDVLAQHEESGLHAVTGEAIQNLRSSLRIRSVIEGKSDFRQPLPLGDQNTIDDLAELFVRQKAALLDAFVLDALQHLADGFIVSIGDAQFLQVVSDR